MSTNQTYRIIRLLLVSIALLLSCYDSYAININLPNLVNDYMNATIGCVYQGSIGNRGSAIQLGTASNASECSQSCTSRWLSSQLRGVIVTGIRDGETFTASFGSTFQSDSSVDDIFTTCVSLVGDESCTTTYDVFVSNGNVLTDVVIHKAEITAVTLSPCPEYTITDGSGVIFQDLSGATIPYLRQLDMGVLENATTFTISGGFSSYACTAYTNGQSSESYKGCLSWVYDPSANTCTLYNDAVDGADTWTYATDTEQPIFGNAVCESLEKDVQGFVATMEATKGCVLPNANIPYEDVATPTTTSDFHECRRICQQTDDCVAFVFNEETSLCWPKSPEAMNNYAEKSVTATGTAYCSTCQTGYYFRFIASLTDSCYPCERGYYCSNNVRYQCTAGDYCIERLLEQPETYGGNNVCPDSRTGVACQHHVCQMSSTGQALLQQSFQEPEDFDYSSYQADSIVSTQVLDEESWTLSFDTVIKTGVLPDTMEYMVVEARQTQGTSYSVLDSMRTPVPNSLECPTITYEVTGLAQNELQPGTEVVVCATASWTSNAKPTSWFNLTSETTDTKEVASSCYTLDIQLVTKLSIDLSNIHGSISVGAVVVTYSLDDSSEIKSLTLDADGEYETILQGHSTITIHSATKSGVNTNITYCALGDTCSESQVSVFPQTISLNHLENTNIYLKDVNGRVISGTIDYPNLMQKTNVTNCPVYNATVSVVTTSAGIVIDTTTTDEYGNFQLAVQNGTTTSLVIDYYEHSFTGNDANSKSLLTGVLVQDDISGISFSDSAVPVVTFNTGATLCNYDIGDVKISISSSSPNCPGETSVTAESATTEFQLSGDSFTYSLEYIDNPDFQESFDAISMHTFSVLDGDIEINAQYQPVPELTVSFPDAALDFDDCGSTLPFDVMLEGRQNTSVTVRGFQTFNKQTCYSLPSNTTLHVVSDLALEWGEYGCIEDADCTASFNLVADTYSSRSSIATMYLMVGDPKAPQQTGTGIDPTSITRTVTFRVENDQIWNSDDEATAKALTTETGVLVIGITSLESNGGVSFPSEDSVPLYYLYAPPMTSEDSVASVSFTGSFSTETTTYAEVVNENDVGASVEVSAEAGFWFVHTSVTTSTSVDSVSTNVESLDDRVSTSTDETTYTFETTSAGEDLVLFMGTVADLTEAVDLSFDQSTCTVAAENTMTWGAEVSTLTVYSRSACERDLATANRFIRLYKNDASRADQVQNMRFQRDNWQSLLSHWDNDKRAAQNYPVDLSSAGGSGASGNTLTVSGASVSFSETLSNENSAVTDYDCASGSDTYSASVTASANVDAFFVKASGSATVSGSFSRSYTRELKTTEGNAVDVTRSVTFNTGNELNQLTMNAYRSPHSQSYVFDVTSGQTMCPHVPGTTQIENFSLDYKEKPASLLSSDSGSFAFDIIPLIPSGLDLDLDLVISVDSASATGNIAYTIGSATVNQPFYVSVGDTQTVYVYFERLDSRIRSSTVLMQVASQCDDNIVKTISFKLTWDSPCVDVEWDGDLTNLTSSWFLTNESPELTLAYTQEGSSETGDDNKIESTVEVWGLPYEDSVTVATTEWINLGTFASGSRELTLNAGTASFPDDGRYVLELRRSCSGGSMGFLGATKSSQRLGIFDTASPEVLSWISPKTVSTAVSALQAMTFRFNEPIDCSSSDLSANISRTSGNTVVLGEVGISCSSSLTDVSVVLMLSSEAEMTAWSMSQVTIGLYGVEDLHGNAYKSSAGDSYLERTFVLPSLPLPASGSTAVGSGVPSATKMASMVSSVREALIPSGQAIKSTYIETGDESDDNSGLSKGAKAGIAVGVIVGSLLVIGAAVFAWKRYQVNSGLGNSSFGSGGMASKPAGWARAAKEKVKGMSNRTNKKNEISPTRVEDML